MSAGQYCRAKWKHRISKFFDFEFYIDSYVILAVDSISVISLRLSCTVRKIALQKYRISKVLRENTRHKDRISKIHSINTEYPRSSDEIFDKKTEYPVKPDTFTICWIHWIFGLFVCEYMDIRCYSRFFLAKSITKYNA